MLNIGTKYFGKICGSVQSTLDKGIWVLHITLMQAKNRGWGAESGEKGNSCLMYEDICQAPLVRFNNWVL